MRMCGDYMTNIRDASRAPQQRLPDDSGAADSYAADSSPRSLRWHSHLEPGVRLVQQRIDVLGCCTYRGCEGHPAVGDSGLQLRHVGIVPSDDREHGKLQLLLRRLAARAN